MIDTSIEFGSTTEATMERLVEKLEISQETAGEYMERYWHV